MYTGPGAVELIRMRIDLENIPLFVGYFEVVLR
jgi:hypothetical protein